jgi:hypothetical protein
MQVYVLFGTGGVAGEGDHFLGVYSTRQKAREAGRASCSRGRMYNRDSTSAGRDPGHDCCAGPDYLRCEGTWWDISAYEMDGIPA